MAVLLALFAAGCSRNNEADVAGAREFERFPVYWLGETFEGLDVTRISGAGGESVGVGIIYGTCTPSGFLEPRCTLPLQIQIVPLCFHLDAVMLPPSERMRRIRGAPVGTQDGAPVLLTRKTQIKLYRGEGTDARIPLRALEALRSLNTVAPDHLCKRSDPAPTGWRPRGKAPLYRLTRVACLERRRGDNAATTHQLQTISALIPSSSASWRHHEAPAA